MDNSMILPDERSSHTRRILSKPPFIPIRNTEMPFHARTVLYSATRVLMPRAKLSPELVRGLHSFARLEKAKVPSSSPGPSSLIETPSVRQWLAWSLCQTHYDQD